MAQYTEAIGRRKESSARVLVSAGTGAFMVNDKTLDAYFSRFGDASAILNAFEAAGQTSSAMDVSVHVNGGGVSGQRDAVKLGLARALLSLDEGARKGLRCLLYTSD